MSLGIIASVLDNLAASYLTPSSPSAEPIKASKIRAIKAGDKVSHPSEKVASDGSMTAPKAPPPVVLALPTPGRLTVETAKDYLVASRRAKSREETINAIAAFVGYDRTKDFGVQEMFAKSEAGKLLKPIKAATREYHSCQPSVSGVINAISQVDRDLARTIANLEAREKMTVEAMLAQEKLANAATSTEDRHLHQTLAGVERSRLNQIQKDLKSALSHL